MSSWFCVFVSVSYAGLAFIADFHPSGSVPSLFFVATQLFVLLLLLCSAQSFGNLTHSYDLFPLNERTDTSFLWWVQFIATVICTHLWFIYGRRYELGLSSAVSSDFLQVRNRKHEILWPRQQNLCVIGETLQPRIYSLIKICVTAALLVIFT